VRVFKSNTHTEVLLEQTCKISTLDSKNLGKCLLRSFSQQYFRRKGWSWNV